MPPRQLRLRGDSRKASLSSFPIPAPQGGDGKRWGESGVSRLVVSRREARAQTEMPEASTATTPSTGRARAREGAKPQAGRTHWWATPRAAQREGLGGKELAPLGMYQKRKIYGSNELYHLEQLPSSPSHNWVGGSFGTLAYCEAVGVGHKKRRPPTLGRRLLRTNSALVDNIGPGP